MSAPVDYYDRILRQLEELDAQYYDFGEQELETILVSLGRIGHAYIDFLDVGADALVRLSAVLLTDIDCHPHVLRPLLDWSDETDGARLVLSSDGTTLEARAELLASTADTPELALALSGLHDLTARVDGIAALIGGQQPDRLTGGPDPASWRPVATLSADQVLQRVQVTLAEVGVDVAPTDGVISLNTARGLLIEATSSPDGLLVELAVEVAENIDPDGPNVGSLLELGARFPFGAAVVDRETHRVWLAHELLAETLDADELMTALSVLAEAADSFCDAVAEALGGTVGSHVQTPINWTDTQTRTAGGSPASYVLRPGEAVGGYVVEDTLGSGAFGTVYRARDPYLPRSVALKVLKPRWTHEPEIRQRFLREAQLAARITHPHLVKVHAAGDSDGMVYVAYDLVDGSPLEAVIADEGSMEPVRVARIVSQIAGGLQALHDEGVVHRDIKPANVMLWRPGSPIESVIILDLGVAHSSDDDSLATAMAPGTSYYQGPEVDEYVTDAPSIDLYALALVTYELLTGSGAWGPGPSGHELYHRRQTHALVPFSELGIELPALEQTIARATSVDPADRHGSVEEFAQELRTAALTGAVSGPRTEGGTGRPAPGSTVQPYGEWPPQHVPDPLTSTPKDLAESMLSIVTAEGPVVAERAFRLMLSASDRRQLSSGIEKQLAAAVRLLIKRGLIEADRQWTGRKPRDLVLRATDQPLTRLRQLGPRQLSDVPPRELAAAARHATGRSSVRFDGDVLRATLAFYGRQKASTQFREALRYALEAFGEEK